MFHYTICAMSTLALASRRIVGDRHLTFAVFNSLVTVTSRLFYHCFGTAIVLRALHRVISLVFLHCAFAYYIVRCCDSSSLLKLYGLTDVRALLEPCRVFALLLVVLLLILLHGFQDRLFRQ